MENSSAQTVVSSATLFWFAATFLSCILYYLKKKAYKRIVGLDNSLKELTTKTNQLKSEKQSVELAVDQLSTEKVDCNREIQEKTVKIKNLTQDLNRIQKKLEEAKQSLRERTMIVEKSTREGNTLSLENKKLKSDNEQLSSENQIILGLVGKENELKQKVESLENIENGLLETIEKLEGDQSKTTEELKNTQHEISLFQQVKSLVDFGFIEEPEYLFSTADRYRAEIQEVRSEQKEMIKQGQAIEIPTDRELQDSNGLNTKIIKQQVKLMLQVFNLECDGLINSIKTSNFAKTLERIENTAERIEGLSSTLLCGFNYDFVRLKYKECELYYHYVLKEDEEKEIARAQKEALREEEKVRKECEAVAKKAEKEATTFEKMMEKVKDQLENANEQKKIEFELKLEMLQGQLEEAQQAGQRAKSMAEQTRRGYVYVISNVGAFGEGVFKIGLTRRLDPLERVKELSGASVPFPFEHHILVYSEDAPTLETTLHKAFSDQKINVVNQRKEFFFAEFEEIKDKIYEIKRDTDHVSEIFSEAKALQYFESRKINGYTTTQHSLR